MKALARRDGISEELDCLGGDLWCSTASGLCSTSIAGSCANALDCESWAEACDQGTCRPSASQGASCRDGRGFACASGICAEPFTEGMGICFDPVTCG